jgi:MYXO-CTERM domain-containing protein
MLPAILAFCGFYVAGSNQQMFNDATQVVLMREGTRTVLAMQNNYKGPPEAFAMVVPVPTVLHEGDVKTLAKDVFAHVEQMGAPRLVEYWEQDPCNPIEYDLAKHSAGAGGVMPAPTTTAASLGVKIEAQFTVGEYQIVILSAKDSSGLETWLRGEKYNIPDGAEPLLRPYVESGSKFFVAKVDPQKVKFEDGRAALSPLRFHYDSDRFELPIRLGLANSAGTQDLIVNILATERYEVANHPNVTIPTNLDVTPMVKDKFGAFYAALFDRTVEQHPGAVVTEYAWAAGSCDPCPGPTLNASDFQTLGADVLPGQNGYNLVLTRLHARYGKEIKDDLVFKAAQPIVGGREHMGAQGQLESGALPASTNNFQGRYAIRHPWTGPIACEKPRRNVWGGPPPGSSEPPVGVKPALGIAFAPRGEVQLASALAHPDPQIDLGSGAWVGSAASAGSAAGSAVAPPATPPARATTKKKSGCGCATEDRNELGTAAFLVGASLLFRRRKRS